MHLKLEANPKWDVGGFSGTNALAGEQVPIVVRAGLSTNDQHFHLFINNICNVFFSNTQVFLDSVYAFLIIIHPDRSVDLLINDSVHIEAKIRAKRNISKGQMITKADIADIEKIRFQGIPINSDDKFILCKKVDWRFGLYFDLTRKIDLELMENEIGTLYRTLLFNDLFQCLSNNSRFNELLKDGWFPFIEIIGAEFDQLLKIYSNNFNVVDELDKLVSHFNDKRISDFTGKWWTNEIFKAKRPLIEAGITAFLQGDEPGIINSINTLMPQIEGILRLTYFKETTEPNASIKILLEDLQNKGVSKSKSTSSLTLPEQFFTYLNSTIFQHFVLGKGDIHLSRHTAMHGVVDPEKFTKIKALQVLLSLDQIYFYIH